jgi:diacylglycerol kinase family enzyme
LKKTDLIFLESFGCGLFPELMQRMKEIPEREDATPEENLKTALQELHKLVLNYKPKKLDIKIDGTHYEERFLLAEVMNIASIGPNLNLSPDSDPGDGEFEVILIPDSQRQELAAFVEGQLNGAAGNFPAKLIKGREIVFNTSGGLMHTDDELYNTKKPKKIRIKPEWGMMEFFVQ